MRDAPVEELDAAPVGERRFAQEHVVELEIAMNDAGAVGGAQHVAELE
jgi:hypothetical protein